MKPVATPDHGGRVTLIRQTQGDREICYKYALVRAGVETQGTLRVGVLEGSVTFDPEPDGAAGWLIDLARALARGAWHHRATAGWPRRITRWRADPERR